MVHVLNDYRRSHAKFPVDGLFYVFLPAGRAQSAQTGRTYHVRNITSCVSIVSCPDLTCYLLLQDAYYTNVASVTK